MKRILLSLAVILTAGALNAQIYSAADSSDFAQWTVADLDGDGNNWSAAVINNAQITAPGFNGASGFISNSWATNPLTPDNIAITPAIDCSGAATVYVNWICGSPETTASGWYQEKYAVYVILAADLPALMAGGAYPAPVFETVLAGGEQWFSESVDVSAIAGSQGAVHVILRHYDCTDMNWIFVDEFEVSTSASTEEVSVEAIAVNAFPNPATSELNVEVNVEATTVSIISMDGKVVATQDFNGAATTVNISNLNAGVYIYEVATVNGVVRNTFVKK